MHTVQPVIFDMSLDILGKSAVRRIKEVLENSAIPYAEVSYRHLSSSFTPYDDSFSVRTVVSDADADKAMGIIAKVMSGLDAEGVSMVHLPWQAKGCYPAAAERPAKLPVFRSDRW